MYASSCCWELSAYACHPKQLDACWSVACTPVAGSRFVYNNQSWRCPLYLEHKPSLLRARALNPKPDLGPIQNHQFTVSQLDKGLPDWRQQVGFAPNMDPQLQPGNAELDDAELYVGVRA